MLEADEPLSRRERRLLARVAAQEAADWDDSEERGGLTSGETGTDSDDLLVSFARKLSREPWQMEASDLERMRAAGYSEEAVLHAISVVAHQNADSRRYRRAAGCRPGQLRVVAALQLASWP